MTKFIISIMFISLMYAGGGWTKEKGKAFLKYELRLINAKKFYNFDASKAEINKTSYVTHSIYGEYGLLDKLTLSSSIPFKSLSTNGNTVSGIGDISLAAKYGLIQGGPTVLAVDLGFTFNTGKSDDPTLWTGKGQNSTLIGLSMGHSLWPLNAYFNIGLYYNLQSKLDNETHYAAEFGYKFGSFLAAVKLRGIISEADLKEDIIRSAFYQTEYHAFGLELNYFVNDGLGFTLAMDGAFKAKNNFAAPSFSLGVFANL